MIVIVTVAMGAGLIWMGKANGWPFARNLADSAARGGGRVQPPVASAGRSPGIAEQAPAATAASTGRFDYAKGDGKVLGTAGRQYRFRAAAEQGIDVEVSEFAQHVEATLGDPRSWIAGRNVRFRRVADASNADFTIYLATPATAEKLCEAGGISTIINGVPYTSCRVGDSVVINLDRFDQGVPNYGADLSVYRQYVVNHEVGHFVGQNHVGCPGQGRPAPVMQQQTLSLSGCVANAWPYLNGSLYTGPPGGQ